MEIRGEFEPIATAVAGIQICELLPKLASIADRVSFVRSLVGSDCRCENWFDRPFHFDFAEVTSIGSSSHWSFSQALVLAESVRCLLDLSKIEARVGGRREASRVRLHPVRNLVTQPE